MKCHLNLRKCTNEGKLLCLAVEKRLNEAFMNKI